MCCSARRDTERHLEVVAEAIKDAPGAVILFRDITELRRTNVAARFRRQRSHELRTPLSILRGYLETLLETQKHLPLNYLHIFSKSWSGIRTGFNLLVTTS